MGSVHGNHISVWSLSRTVAPRRPGNGLLLAGSLLYLAGAFLVTMICNVPRNNRLAAVDPATAEGARVWSAYLREWTAWNHVRTVASAAATVAFILALRL